MRDIGGYECQCGKKIKDGMLIRSNVPCKLQETDIDFLKKIGIYTAIDLRSKEEIEKNPSVFEYDSLFKIYHIGIDIGKNIPNTCEDVPKNYIEMLTLKNNIKKIFRILKEHKKVIYFCNAGKDRTGVITALILNLLGVDDEHIIYDYMLTKEYMKRTLERYANFNSEILNIIIPQKIYMIEFLRMFKEKYKNTEEYLRRTGIKDREIEIL